MTTTASCRPSTRGKRRLPRPASPSTSGTLEAGARGRRGGRGGSDAAVGNAASVGAAVRSERVRGMERGGADGIGSRPAVAGRARNDPGGEPTALGAANWRSLGVGRRRAGARRTTDVLRSAASSCIRACPVGIDFQTIPNVLGRMRGGTCGSAARVHPSQRRPRSYGGSEPTQPHPVATRSRPSTSTRLFRWITSSPYAWPSAARNAADCRPRMRSRSLDA